MTLERDFAANPDVVAVVGAFRTGAHWLCMLMQEYFGHSVAAGYSRGLQEPHLAFFTRDAHRLMGSRHQAIYIYRDPVDTAFLQSKMDPGWEHNQTNVQYHAGLYGDHLACWLTPGHVAHLAIVRYECLRADFPRVCLLFNQLVDEERLDRAFESVTREKAAQSSSEPTQPWPTCTDPQSNLERTIFREKYASVVWERLIVNHEWLKIYFGHLPEEKQW